MSQANEAERFMLDLINAERAAVGLEAVVLDTRLNDASEDHSDWMLDTDTFSHRGEGGSSAGDRMDEADFDFSGGYGWGENIAWQSERGDPDIQDDVADLHESLMNSPGHRANILNPEFEAIGIGIEVGSFDGFEAVMVTQNFAYTDGALAPDTGTTPPAPQPPVIPAPAPETPPEPEPPIAELPTPTPPETPPVVVEEPVDQAPCLTFIDWEWQQEPSGSQNVAFEQEMPFDTFFDAIQSLFDNTAWDFWGSW